MGSPCALHIYCHDEQHFATVSALCEQRLEQLEAKYSRYRDSSLLSKINAASGTEKVFRLDDESWLLMQYANTAYQISDGMFDITSGVLRKAWNFNSVKLPEQSQIDKALKLVGWENIQLDIAHFRLPLPGMEIDFGGIVKEYAADALAGLLNQQGVNHGLVDLAGDIAIVGPHPNNQPWQVSIKNPVNPSQAIANIPLSSGGLASSGDYERCIELSGKKYSHILNPNTGWPIHGYAAISVWAPQCVVAGTLATIAMLKENEGKAFLQNAGARFVCVDQSGSVFTQ